MAVLIAPLARKAGAGCANHCLFPWLALVLLSLGSAPLSAQGPIPRAPAPAIAARVGEYGVTGDTIVVLERANSLIAVVAGVEHAVKPRNFVVAGGRATALRLKRRTLPRLAVGTDEGVTFRVTPLHPIAELRTAALAATPPRDTAAGTRRPADLVELVTLDPSIRLDIRYASSNNFLGAPMYSSARAFMQRAPAEALVRAHRALAARGFGLLIHDAYRPWYVTKMFWDATTGADHGFVADPAQGSRHNRGAAVDLTLYELAKGTPVRMPGGYDEFSHRSYANYPGGTALERWRRSVLRDAMEHEGFTVNPSEWWHFDFAGWREYGVLNLRFEEIGRAR